VAAALVGISVYIVVPPGLTRAEQIDWTAAVLIVGVGAVGTLALHELAHILVSRRGAEPMFASEPALFGALPDTVYNAESPARELRVALAGPLASLACTAMLAGLWYAVPTVSRQIEDALGIAAAFAGGLTLLSLMPGYPFDGSRILRAFIWHLTDDLILASRLVTFYGYVLTMTGLLIGVLLISLGQDWAVWGMWLLLLFWMLNGSIREGSNHVYWRENSKRLVVDDLFVGSGRRLPAGTTIDDAIETLLEAYGHGPTLVTDGDDAVGIVHLGCIRQVPRAIWTERCLRDVMLPLASHRRVGTEQPLADLVALLPPGSNAIVLIERKGKVVAATDRQLVVERLRDYLHAERIARMRGGRVT
jgi:Zn-dependent protease